MSGVIAGHHSWVWGGATVISWGGVRDAAQCLIMSMAAPTIEIVWPQMAIVLRLRTLAHRTQMSGLQGRGEGRPLERGIQPEIQGRTSVGRGEAPTEHIAWWGWRFQGYVPGSLGLPSRMVKCSLFPFPRVPLSVRSKGEWENQLGGCLPLLDQKCRGLNESRRGRVAGSGLPQNMPLR